ncbi:MAG: sulfurtransferase [Burkholderiaceae bacterium]
MTANPATPARFTTLISAADLAPHVNDPSWVILDCRHDLADPHAGRAAYDAGHIVGAHFASIDADLSDQTQKEAGMFPGRHPLPSRAAFLATLRRWGIDDDTQVIAYDAQGGMFAARLWWLLRWVGHAAVAVLDGGLPSWTAARQAQTPAVTPRAARSGAIGDRPSLVTTVGANTILADIGRSERTVIDARAPERFRGENETLDPVGGHIPGAVNRFFRDNLQADGRFKAPDVLYADFTALTAAPSAAIMQCGSGVTACHNLLAMEVAGLAGAALYPGSWSEWCADRTRPVATGDPASALRDA